MIVLIHALHAQCVDKIFLVHNLLTIRHEIHELTIDVVGHIALWSSNLVRLNLLLSSTKLLLLLLLLLEQELLDLVIREHSATAH